MAYWHNAKFEPEWTWKGKSLYLEEISSATLNSDTLIAFLSNESYEGTVLVKQRPIELKIDGKPVIFVTTASKNPRKDHLRRFAMCQLNDSVDQTKEILRRQSEFAKSGKPMDYDPKITKALSKLKRVKVKIPFADKLAEALLNKIPNAHKILRTNFPRFLDIIKAVTALYQYQREIDGEDYLIATLEDYEKALPVLNKITETSSTIPLTKEKKKILEVIRELGEGEFHEVSEIDAKITFCSKPTLYKRLRELADDGFLIQERITRIDERERSYKTIGYKLSLIFDFKFPTLEELLEKKFKTVKSIKTVKTVNSVNSVGLDIPKHENSIKTILKPTDLTVLTDLKEKTKLKKNFSDTEVLTCYPKKKPENFDDIRLKALKLGLTSSQFEKFHDKLKFLGNT